TGQRLPLFRPKVHLQLPRARSSETDLSNSLWLTSIRPITRFNPLLKGGVDSSKKPRRPTLAAAPRRSQSEYQPTSFTKRLLRSRAWQRLLSERKFRPAT